MDKDEVSCCDEDVLSWFDEGVLACLDKNNKENFDGGFIHAPPSNLVVVRVLGWAAVKNKLRGWWGKRTSEGNWDETGSKKKIKQWILENYWVHFISIYL